MSLKKIINHHSDELSFWAKIQNDDNRYLLFEEFVANYLKATLPGDTYWLDTDVVPADIADEHNFTHLLKGMRSEGADIINISKNGAIAYEVKWKDDDTKSIVLGLIAPKVLAIGSTKITQLICCTNSTSASANVFNYGGDVGFMYQDTFFSKEAFDIVKKFTNKKVKKVYRALTPRDAFFSKVLDDNDSKFKNHLKTNSVPYKELRVRTFMHWPAATGKGSLPRLAYDMTYEKCWNYKKDGYPINTVVNPTLAVLKGNLTKVVEHSLALKLNEEHVIFAGDVTRGAPTTDELAMLRSITKVFKKKKEFIEYIRSNPEKTIWVHTTIHGYTNLAEIINDLGKSIYFSHIDEVHHAAQPDWSDWKNSLDDTTCKVNIRFMTSANKRMQETGTAQMTYSMGHPDFCDYETLPLTEKKAYQLGYKRKTNILYTGYDKKSFPEEMIEQFLDKDRNPMIKVAGTKAPVPLTWFMAADALIKFKLEYEVHKHTLLTLNRIDDCVKFAEFFEAIRIPLLALHEVDKETFHRLSKAKIFVADTKSSNTVKILKEVSLIPKKNDDSFIIHCMLLGEGWDPEDGWLDSSMFVDPTWSDIRIYQTLNRATRIGNGFNKIHRLLMVGFEDDGFGDSCCFQEMFSSIELVGNVLEIGDKDIKDFMEFSVSRPTPKSRGKNKPRSPFDTDFDEFGADWLFNKYRNFKETGRTYAYGETVNVVVSDFLKAVEDYGLWLGHHHGIGPGRLVMEKIVLDNIRFFEQYTDPMGRFKTIVNGNDHRISTTNHMKLLDLKERKPKERDERMKFFRKNNKLINEGGGYSKSIEKLCKMYAKKFGPIKTLDVSDMIGKEHILHKDDKKYSYATDESFSWMAHFSAYDFYYSVTDYKHTKMAQNTSTSIEKFAYNQDKPDTWIKRILRRVA